MSQASDRDEKTSLPTVDRKDVDIAAAYDRGAPLDPEDASRLRRKIDWYLMSLMCILYLCTFADKTTLGQSAVLGIQKGAHLTQNQFNWLGTVFYLSYLVFQYPQNLALQYLPVGKWISINIFLWSVILMAHSACHSFGGLLACRFLLGMCEGAITPGFLLVTSMFYTRDEQTRRVGYWYLMNGVATIFLGLIAFGLLHINPHATFLPWQWLMIITGLLTLVVSVMFWFMFPNNPTTAWFLTEEERIMAVQRIKVNQSGIENKTWKREQFIEAMLDPKTWLFALFSALSNLFNSITNQRQIIVNEFGFSLENTTLLGTVDGMVIILFVWSGVALASMKFIGRAYGAALLFVPGLIGEILVNALPSHNKVGLLLSYYVSIASICAFIVFLGWVGPVTAGHTKKITTNAVVMCGYAIGNIAGPFMWKKQYQPRNHTPWAIITVGSFVSVIILFFTRFLLAQENKRREQEQHDDTYDDVYLSEDGSKTTKVDRAFLDLTDRQNRDFRYVL